MSGDMPLLHSGDHIVPYLLTVDSDYTFNATTMPMLSQQTIDVDAARKVITSISSRHIYINIVLAGIYTATKTVTQKTRKVG